MVTTVVEALADALVCKTSRDVRTQCIAYGTEVVGSVELSFGTFDVLVEDIATNVVSFVVAQIQGQVVGQEVTEANTWVGAVVLKIALAIVVLLGNVTFDLNRALALCQSAERSYGYKRTNGQAQGVFQFHPLNPHLVIVKQSHQHPGDNSTASLAELAGTLEIFARH
ncbi:hypothetical protein D3C81_1200900 [compost metagenome]